MKHILARTAGVWRVIEQPNHHRTLPPGLYMLSEDVLGLYLEELDPFEMPSVLYGNVDRQAQRILDTFESRRFITGVLLEGEKGSGKTLLAKRVSYLALTQKVPTILINDPHRGDAFNKFLQQLTQPCVLLFDEFEKVYHEKSWQHELLTILDGTVPTKKLCILTVNESRTLDVNLLNRPGRLFYALSFEGLDESFIREYVAARLTDQSHAEGVVRLATMFTSFNFDQLQALIEEMNRFNEGPYEALKWLNIQPSHDQYKEYDVVMLDPRNKPLKPYEGEEEWQGNPFDARRRALRFHYYVPVAPSKRRRRGEEQVEAQTFDAAELVSAERGIFTFKNGDKYTLRLSPKPPKRLRQSEFFNPDF